MKVFISVPMKDKTDEEIKKEIAIVTNIAKAYFPEENALGTLEFVDNFTIDTVNILGFHSTTATPSTSKRLYQLGEALQRLSTCDAIMSPEYYGFSIECEIEGLAARHYSIKVYEYDNSVFNE